MSQESQIERGGEMPPEGSITEPELGNEQPRADAGAPRANSSQGMDRGDEQPPEGSITEPELGNEQTGLPGIDAEQ